MLDVRLLLLASSLSCLLSSRFVESEQPDDTKSCLGYEPNCTPETRFSNPVCDGDSGGWTSSKAEQIETFFLQGDFGYVGSKRKTLATYCSPHRTETSAGTVNRSSTGSYLECTDHLHFCRGNGLNLDLRPVASRTDNLLYKMDVLEPGNIRGNCALDEDRLKKNSDELSPLQSWGPEFRNFVGTDKEVERFDEECDMTFDRPVYVMKLDAEVNMYHHFCDFLNLYASLHINNDGGLMADAWTTDVQILLWQSIPYRSNFGLAWRAFTRHPLLTIRELAGKRLCFRAGVVFPLLPRMIFGLYYNTPIVPGCRGSSLFREFNRFIVRGMLGEEEEKEEDVAPRFGPDDPVRVTFLSRLTQHRRVANEGELLDALRRMPGVAVTRAAFTFWTPFRDQVEPVARSTDLLIGMHGSGLTHSLFLPDWAAVFELYNCGDGDCYADLARLRGLRYYTWPSGDHQGVSRVVDANSSGSKYDGHEKFANYSFDVTTFKKIVREAVDGVLEDRGRLQMRGRRVRKLDRSNTESVEDPVRPPPAIGGSNGVTSRFDEL